MFHQFVDLNAPALSPLLMATIGPIGRIFSD
jgi:hypothetical protein